MTGERWQGVDQMCRFTQRKAAISPCSRTLKPTTQPGTSTSLLIIEAATTALRPALGWLSTPAFTTSSFPKERAGSICRRAGGGSSAVMPWLDRVLPTPTRSSRPLASLQLSSTGEPTLGSGDVPPRIIATTVASFLIAFKERSTKNGQYGLAHRSRSQK